MTKAERTLLLAVARTLRDQLADPRRGQLHWREHLVALEDALAPFDQKPEKAQNERPFD